MNAYDGRAILCRRCLQNEVPAGELMAYLDNYVRSLPEETRVSDDIYRARLRECAACPHIMQELCTLCGCYAQARAAKRNQRCPLPGAPKWLENGE